MAKTLEEEREELRRKREREEEREQEELAESQRSALKKGGSVAAALTSNDPGLLFDGLLKQAQGMLEQVNALYRQYFTGVERRPPLEARTRLEAAVESLQKAQKPTASYQFRFNAFQSSYVTHRDRWEKQVKDFESGKIKPVTGPKFSGGRRG